MPTFNAQRFLVEAIESIILQDCTDWELLVLDGGSQDMTLEIVALFASRDPRIRLVLSPGSHPTDRTNSAIREAKGIYIAVHHADDVSAASRLSILGAFLDENPECALVGSANRYWLHDVRRPDIHGYSGLRKYPVGYGEILANLPFYWSFSLPSIAFRRAFILQHDIFFNNAYRFCADYDWFYRVASLARVDNVETPLLSYRHHSDSDGPQHREAVEDEAKRIRRSIIEREFGFLEKNEQDFLGALNVAPSHTRINRKNWRKAKRIFDQKIMHLEDKDRREAFRRVYEEFLMVLAPPTWTIRLKEFLKRRIRNYVLTKYGREI